MNLKTEIKLLRNVYFAVFFAGALLVVLMHTLASPNLDVFRVPTFISQSVPFNHFNYPLTFHLYQFTVIFSLMSILVDGFCLTRYRSLFLIEVSKWTSVFGGILMLFAIAFFGYNFLIVDHTLRLTPIIYLAFSLFLVALDYLTFNVDELLETKNNV